MKAYFCPIDLSIMKKYLLLILLPTMAFAQSSLKDVEFLIQQKEYEKAESRLIDYLEIHPNSIEGLELLGDTYGHQKQWDNAISNYKKLVDIKPSNANYHYKYGGALGMKALENKFKAIGFISDIKNSFLKASELDKEHIEVRWALVELYMQLPAIFGGSKNKALHFTEELENISIIDGYLSKGYVYEYDNEPELAEEYYKKAIKEGGSLICFEKLTKLYESTNEPQRAIENIENAQIKHNRNSLHYQIGKISAEYNIELQKGEHCLQTYLKNYSTKDGVPKAWAHYRLAQIQLHKNNKEAALKYIDLALAELPKIKPFKEEKQKIINL